MVLDDNWIIICDYTTTADLWPSVTRGWMCMCFACILYGHWITMGNNRNRALAGQPIIGGHCKLFCDHFMVQLNDLSGLGVPAVPKKWSNRAKNFPIILNGKIFCRNTMDLLWPDLRPTSVGHNRRSIKSVLYINKWSQYVTKSDVKTSARTPVHVLWYNAVFVYMFTKRLLTAYYLPKWTLNN